MGHDVAPVAGRVADAEKDRVVGALLRIPTRPIIAMIGGRVVWGAARVVMLGVAQVLFGWAAFISGALFTAVPGVILQLILIPAIIVALDKAKLALFSKDRPPQGVVTE